MPRQTIETTMPTRAQYDAMAQSFRRDLEAANKSLNTIDNYMRAVNQFGTFLRDRGRPTDVTRRTLEHVQEFPAEQRTRVLRDPDRDA